MLLGEIEQDASHLYISSRQQRILTARWAENTDTGTHLSSVFGISQKRQQPIIAGSLEAAYSLNWGAREIWGKGGGETLALL